MLRCFPAKRPSPRSLLTTVKYKIDNNSKTKNCIKEAHEYNNSDNNIVHLLGSTSFMKKSDLKHKNYYKWLYLKKTKNRRSKMSASLFPIYPANLATCSWFFGRPKAPFGRPWRPNTIWCDMTFYAHNFLSTFFLSTFFSHGHFWWGGAGRGGILHILSCDRAPLATICIKTLRPVTRIVGLFIANCED